MAFKTRRASTGNGAFPISTSRALPSSKLEFPPPPRPKIPALRRLHKTRTIILPILLIIVFTTLVLGAIYSYCVAKPHTDIASQLAVDSNAEADSSIFGKREVRSFASVPTTATSDAKDAPETALMFYTVTVPLLSMFHIAFELITHHNTPRLLSLRKVYIALITASVLLICGWVVSLSFWMHCELPVFNKNKIGQGVCPVQTRGHFMYGIHEVSITRLATGWAVVAMYMVHVLFLGLGYKAQKRIWRIVGSTTTKDVDRTFGEARVITVRFDEGAATRGAGLAKEADVV
jgi:hypothetical protein